MHNIGIVFRGLRNKNYRLFFFGQGISLIGTWMQSIAVSWLAYRMTNSIFLLGLVGFSLQIPAFILSPLAGVAADRHDRRRLLILTQALSMVQAFILAMLVLTNTVAVWQIIALSMFLGTINAFDIPIRQSFLIEMIDNKEDLGNAIALNSSMLNMARLIGPSIAGFLIAIVGEGICFLVNGVSYLAVIASLWAMRIQPRDKKINSGDILTRIKEGFSYAFNFVPIRILLLTLGLVSLVGGGLQTLMPVFARDIFHGGPQTLGLLMAATGLGAFTGAVFLASRDTVLGLGQLIGLASTLFGLCLIAFSLSNVLGLSLGLLFISGFGMMIHMASSNTLIQLIVEDDKRGRVMSFYTMAFMGTAPIGSIIAGSLAARWNVHIVLFASGILCLIGSAVFRSKLPVLREKIRPIYAEKGIIPQVAKGLGQATTRPDGT